MNISTVFSSVMWISFSGVYIHRCFSLYGGVFRNKVSLTGMVEVNSLTSAGMVLTSNDSWEASSYIMGSDFRDLGNIKTIF